MRDGAGQRPQEQQRLSDSRSEGEQGAEHTGHSGHSGHSGPGEHGGPMGHGAHTDRRGPQLVPSTTTTGPLSPAERRFEGRPPTDHRQPLQPAGHASEPHARDAEDPGRGHGNGSSEPAMDGHGTPQRNGTFVVSERTPRNDDDDGDEPESDLRELPRHDVRGDVGPLIDSLRTVFEHDRGVASQGGNARCGICYLHFPLSELEYRAEEGYYVCPACKQQLGSTRLPMVRRQQR